MPAKIFRREARKRFIQVNVAISECRWWFVRVPYLFYFAMPWMILRMACVITSN